MREHLAALATLAVALSHGGAGAQVRSVAEMNADQVRALDRTKTAVILPGGILEQHGPYLPAYTDGYFNERIARDVAEAVAARPGWVAVVFPAIPLGTDGTNAIGRKFSFPGTFAVRAATLRAVFMDLADEIGELGFRFVFVVHVHGSPRHNHALDQAAAYFEDTYGGRMVHLLGGTDFLACCHAWKSVVSAEALAEDASSVHAGLTETSEMLFLRPDLVAETVRRATRLPAADPEARETSATAADWPGYFGAPARATAAVGAALNREQARFAVASALAVLDGTSRPGERVADARVRHPRLSALVREMAARDDARERRQREWLARRPEWPAGER